ncbi:MAG: cytochrome C oxidase subunit IV family protein [Bdellovibrionales bacterium]
MAGHHIIPLKTYFKVAGALFVLTILTVIFHEMKLGALAGPVAFLIAAVKAALVLLYFMHLKYDNMINRVVFGSGFFFLLLLFAFSAMDIWTRITHTSTL